MPPLLQRVQETLNRLMWQELYKKRSVCVSTEGNCASMLSLAPDEDDAVGISLHSCPLCAVMCLLCLMLQGEETVLEVRYVHAIWYFD